MPLPQHFFKDNFLDLLIDAVCVVNSEGVFLFVSAAAERIFGYSPAEMIGMTVFDLVHPDDRHRTQQAIDAIHTGQEQNHFENRYVRKDGSIANVMWSARWSEAEKVRVAVARDVTRLRHEERVRSAMYSISEAANDAEDVQALFQRIHAVVRELVPADNFFLALREPCNGELDFPYATASLDTRGSHALVTEALCNAVIRDGKALLLDTNSAAALLGAAGINDVEASLDWLGVPLSTPSGLIGVLVLQNHAGKVRYTDEDMNLLSFVSIQVASAIERTRTHLRLQYMAQHDPLTGLPNRSLVLDRLNMALSRARRENLRLAVLFLDMDYFKAVNDQYGHLVGDRLLQEVALRLKRIMRESDTVGRLGGDEFVVILDVVDELRSADIVSNKIINEVSAPCHIDGHVLRLIPSIGIATYPDHGETERELLRRADDAMYHAKRSR